MRYNIIDPSKLIVLLFPETFTQQSFFRPNILMIKKYPKFEPYPKRSMFLCKNPSVRAPNFKKTISSKSSAEEVVMLLRNHEINARFVTEDLVQVKCNKVISNVKIINDFGRIRWGCSVTFVDLILRENQ